MRQVGDAAPILEVVAVMLESISSVTVMARNTMNTVYRTAQIVAALPNSAYQNKASPAHTTRYLLSAISYQLYANLLICRIRSQLSAIR